MRFHVIGLPHTQTTRAFNACAFTNKVRGFCRMMMGLGHEVYLYSGEENDTPCTEHVSLYSERDRKKALGGKHFIEASWNSEDKQWRQLNARAQYEIRSRILPHDFICLIGGRAMKPIADAFPNIICVEFGIGYAGSFAKCRVWESYAWMHTCYGNFQIKGGPNAVDGLWYDAVIPGYVNMNDFPMTEMNTKENYCLYIGRMTDRKGYKLVADACEHADVPLILAGPGIPFGSYTGYGKYIGEVSIDARGPLMSKARAVLAPSFYIEPFGNVVVEAHACGTPTITTDWGAFTETNKHGVTGYRCRSLLEFVEAIEKCKSLNSFTIWKRCQMKYSEEVIAPRYEDYFLRCLTLWRDGFYAMDRKDTTYKVQHASEVEAETAGETV
jgi:glycosyltransferase involved in cell wall biosynthesis